MAKLFSSQEIIKTLLSRGFVFVSQKGSPAKYRKARSTGGRTVIVPQPRKEIPRGTFASILRQSGLSREDFR